MPGPLTVCVCDYWKRRHYYNCPPLDREAPAPAGELRRLRLAMNAINGHYCLREFVQQRALALRLQRRHGVELIWLELEPPARETIDYKWAEILAHTIWQHIAVEHLMSWLSTLGGGFSALGEQFERCAKTAGKISLQQLKIGLRLGDPCLQARCKLYYGVSLIQRGHLRAAKHLIRDQFEFALVHREKDRRLVRMCQGVWMRLVYEYQQRRLRIKQSQSEADYQAE